MNLKWLAVLLLLLGALYFSHSYVNEQTKFLDGLDFNKYMTVIVQASPGNEGKLVKLTFSDTNLISELSRGLVVVDTNGRIVPFTVVGLDYLPYWIEPASDGTPYLVWVKVPRIPAGGSATLFIEKNSDFSPNGYGVFDFFCDFERDLCGLQSIPYSEYEYDPRAHDWVRVRYGGAYGYVLSHADARDGYTVALFPGASYTDSFVFEAEYMIPSPPVSRAVWGGFAFGQSTTFYHFTIDYYNPSSPSLYRQDIRYAYPGNVQTEYDRDFPGLADTWRKLRIVWVWSGSEWTPTVYVDGEHKVVFDTLWSRIRNKGINPLSIGVVSAYYVNTYRYWDNIRVRKYAPHDVNVSVVDVGGYYVVTITNPNDSDLVDFQVSIPASDLGVTSIDEGLAIYQTFDVYFDPGYDGTWTTRKFYILYGTDIDTARFADPTLDLTNVGTFTISLSQPRDVSPYPGYAHVEVSPASNDPGTYTVTAYLTTENPDSPNYAECEWRITDPVTSNVTTYETNGPLVQSIDVLLTNEGVYTIDYNCHIFLTSPIAGTVTHTIVIPNPEVPSLHIETNLPTALSSESNVTVAVYVTSGSPVSNANVYLTLNNSVTYHGVTGADGAAYFTLTLSPGDVVKIAAYKSGYHPAELTYTISAPSEGGGTSGGAPVPPPAGGGAPGGAQSTAPAEVTQPEVVQPASPTPSEAAGSGALLFAGLILIFLIGVYLVRHAR